jgi:hypothetical protein
VRRSLTALAVGIALAVPMTIVADCGGRTVEDVDASVQDTHESDAAYEGICCNYYDGPSFGTCDHDVNVIGVGVGDTFDGSVFCGYGVEGWTHCAYLPHSLINAWACCRTSDRACCPAASEPDEAGDPYDPSLCNGYGPGTEGGEWGVPNIRISDDLRVLGLR